MVWWYCTLSFLLLMEHLWGGALLAKPSISTPSLQNTHLQSPTSFSYNIPTEHTSVLFDEIRNHLYESVIFNILQRPTTPPRRTASVTSRHITTLETIPQPELQRYCSLGATHCSKIPDITRGRVQSTNSSTTPPSPHFNRAAVPKYPGASLSIHSSVAPASPRLGPSYRICSILKVVGGLGKNIHGSNCHSTIRFSLVSSSQ